MYLTRRQLPAPLLGLLTAGAARGQGRADYRFNRLISRQALDSYLARAVSHAGLCACSPEEAATHFDDDLRMLAHIGAKFIGRAAYAWLPPDDDDAHFRLARERADRAHAADPDMILEAAVFEAIYEKLGNISVPEWVFAEFKQPAAKRAFRYADMLYDGGKFRDHWMKGASVPDMSKLETRMWFTYRACRYIEAGFEAIHFGQVHLMDQNDPEHRYWLDVLTRIRRYAALHGRRRMALCTAHTHGVVLTGNRLLFDYHAWPLRPREVRNQPERVEVAEWSDSIVNHSEGGIAPSGWQCDALPYLVEFDNFGSSGKGHQARVGPPWVWGFDEIDWFAHQPEAARNGFLRTAFTWLAATDAAGHLQMPARRNLADPAVSNGVETRMYCANRPSAACPEGFNQEETIRGLWNGN
jgi:hypothetical protein